MAAALNASRTESVPVAQAVVQVRALRKRFRREDGTTVTAAHEVELDVESGRIVVLLGPSGCGKTTLLRCIAGLERPDAGRILMNGEVVFDARAGIDRPTERRRFSMIFQSYALWPNMTVYENVAYPLKARGMRGDQVRDAVKRSLELVQIGHLSQQYPNQISGGQQQRVALARALVPGDRLILFDEPLSNVDARVRERLRTEIAELQRAVGFSAVYVTHDQTEAMALGHEIAVMEAGRIVQRGAPRDVYEHPLSQYVAEFMGATNQLRGKVARVDATGVAVETGLGTLLGHCGEKVVAGSSVVLVLRPEFLRLTVDEPASPNRWQGRVSGVLYLGAVTQHTIATAAGPLHAWTSDHDRLRQDDNVWVSIDPASAWVVGET